VALEEVPVGDFPDALETVLQSPERETGGGSTDGPPVTNEVDASGE
jgi:hypothetical protein